MIKIRAAVILERKGRILLAKHRKQTGEYWVLPGGTVEEGETLQETAAREIREETGLEAEIEKLAFVSEVIDKGPGHKHIIDFFFKGKIRGGDLKRGTDRNLTDIRFFPPGELDSLVFYPDIKEELKKATSESFRDVPAYLGNRQVRKNPEPDY